MKKVVALILCIVSVISLFMLIGLKEEVDSLQSQLMNVQNNLQNSINNISYNVQHTIQEDASIIAECDFLYKNVDYEKRTVTARFTVTPKEYNALITKTSMICNGQEYPMTLENGAYYADIELSFAESASVTKFIFNDDGNVRSEVAELGVYPRNDFLPSVNVDFSGGYAYEKGKYKINGSVFVDIFAGENVEITSAEFVEEINGVEKKRYTAGDRNNGTAVQMRPELDFPINAGNIAFDSEITAEYELPVGSTLAIYLEVKDSKGWCYRSYVESITVTKDGEFDYHDELKGLEASVYDEKGNLIFTVDEEFYE
ncbi:MAG: hypothetical protein IJO48_03840 [Clostridia bacterium]|nr:hypothetical protein [Clostridia bacterium]